jgi:hypothetical protein
LTARGQAIGALILLDTPAPAHCRRGVSARFGQSFTNRLLRVGQPVRAPWTALRSAVSAAGPIVRYVRSGLYLLTATAKRRSTAPDRGPAMLEMLRWAALDSWRTRLLADADIAPLLSGDALLQLIDLPDVRRVLAFVGRHRRLARRYVAAGYRGRLTLVRAVPEGQVAHQIDDLTLGWRDLAPDGVDLRTIPANHVALLVNPYVDLVAREVRECLERSHIATTDATARRPDCW